jgi:pilus assembly protein Flp/PilA
VSKLFVNAVTLLNEVKRDARGVTAIVYGLIGVAMAVDLAAVLVAADGAFLAELTDAFDGIASALSTATD